MEFVKKESKFECSKEYDSWENHLDSNGQMEQCVIVKKSSLHGMKVSILNDNLLGLSYAIPSKIMNAYFGESTERRRNIIEIIVGSLKGIILKGSQNKAFEEMKVVFDKIKT